MLLKIWLTIVTLTFVLIGVSGYVEATSKDKPQYECSMRVVLANTHARNAGVILVCQCTSTDGERDHWVDRAVCDKLMEEPLIK